MLAEITTVAGVWFSRFPVSVRVLQGTVLSLPRGTRYRGIRVDAAVTGRRLGLEPGRHWRVLPASGDESW